MAIYQNKVSSHPTFAGHMGRIIMILLCKYGENHNIACSNLSHKIMGYLLPMTEDYIVIGVITGDR